MLLNPHRLSIIASSKAFRKHELCQYSLEVSWSLLGAIETIIMIQSKHSTLWTIESGRRKAIQRHIEFAIG